MRDGSPIIIEERSEGLLPRLGAFLAVLAVSAALTLLAWAIWELSTALSVAVVLVAGGLALSFILHGVAAVVEAVGRARAHVIEAEGHAQAATGARPFPALNRAGDTRPMPPPTPPRPAIRSVLMERFQTKTKRTKALTRTHAQEEVTMRVRALQGQGVLVVATEAYDYYALPRPYALPGVRGSGYAVEHRGVRGRLRAVEVAAEGRRERFWVLEPQDGEKRTPADLPAD